jgi:hypothetical protein
VEELGADVNQVHNGETALMIAAEDGLLDLVRLLVTDFGADFNEGGELGITPLMAAVTMDELHSVQVLIELGASTESLTEEDCTALMWAADIGHVPMLRCLIEFGALIGAVDYSGCTALFSSAGDGHHSMTQFMLEHAGANMDDVENDGTTVWDKLMKNLRMVTAGIIKEKEDPAALTALLRVMMLHSAPPPELVAVLSCENKCVVLEGARLHARLPAYLAHRHSYLDSRCPRISALPEVLRALIYAFEGPATTKEL